MRRTIRFIYCLLSVIAAFAVPSEAAEREFSLSGAVYRGSEPDLGLTDLWLATLSKQPALKVLDRADMRAILGELSLAGTGEDSARQVRLGRLLGVEYFAWLKVTDDQALMEVVEAATGRGITVVPLRFNKGHIVESLPKLAEQAVEAISRPRPVQSQVAPSLAFTVPAIPDSDVALRFVVDGVLSRLSVQLQRSGVTVLSRRFAQELVTELWRQEKGLIEKSDSESAFMGADYIVSPAITERKYLELSAVEVRTGRRIGVFQGLLADAETDNGCGAINRWMVDRVNPLQKPMFRDMGQVRTNTIRTIAEAVAMLNDGVVLHNGGRYLDAGRRFQEVKAQDCPWTKMSVIDGWIDSCLRLAGFQEVADSLTGISTNTLLGRVVQTKQAPIAPGVSLIGISSSPSVPSPFSRQIGIWLVDILNETTQSPVSVCEDIAVLRDEYDLLVGLNKVEGVTWRRAPPLLFHDAVSAHLDRIATGFDLRLCRIEDYDASRIQSTHIVLSVNDQDQWRAKITAAARDLFSSDRRIPKSWDPPKLVIEGSREELRSRMLEDRANHTVWDYMKMLTKDPAPTDFFWRILPVTEENAWSYDPRVFIQRGLIQWFLHHLPPDHIDRPWVEFREVAQGVPTVEGLVKLADRFPRHVVGVLARYDALLLGMTTGNVEAIQSQLSALIPACDDVNLDAVSKTAAASIRAMEAGLRYSLGKPGGSPTEILNCGLIRGGPPWFRPEVRSASSRAFFYDAVSPNTPEKIKLDIEVYCHLMQRTNETISLRFLRQLVEKQGANEDLASYAVSKYFRLVWWQMEEHSIKDKDYPFLREMYGKTVEEAFGRNPCPFNDFHTGLILRDYQDSSPVSIRVRKAFFKAVKENRVELSREFMEIGGLHDPESERITAERASHSWDRDPLADKTWLNYIAWKEKRVSKKKLADFYRPYLRQLQELHTQAKDDRRLEGSNRLVFQFARVFFKAGEYDLAESLLEQVLNSKKTPWISRHVIVNALFLLAHTKHHHGDVRAALQLSKDALAGLSGGNSCSLMLDFNVTDELGYTHREDNSRGSFEAVISEYISLIRDNPSAPFVNPFGVPK